MACNMRVCQFNNIFSSTPTLKRVGTCVPRRSVRTVPRKIGIAHKLQLKDERGDQFKPEKKPLLRDILAPPVGPGIIEETRKSKPPLEKVDIAKTLTRADVIGLMQESPTSAERMSNDKDWTKVWPTAATFNWTKFPVSVTQGVKVMKRDNPRMFEKDVSLELMKIPNFLHLTDAHLDKHCNALQKYLSKWPSELSSSLAIAQHFPVEIITEDYVRSSPSIREPKSRIVTLKVRVGSLQLNARARDKLIRLAKDRYNAKTDLLTIVGDRCPRRKQNEDYVKYLLTALYMECRKVQEWEEDVKEEDVTKYRWDLSSSRKQLKKIKPDLQDTAEEIQQYKEVLAELHETESQELYDKYRESVIKVLGIKAASSGS
ncbi:28S ribosomal protein S35, mitochondrial [Lingula anatina]|uniref:28S ribosomal protein S35, mitochondrial n=1 Tax=Lingula anatina TaxID=7574 RepID=A0A1S3K3R5_LINAN|nr:28S ribosomal protein S35, mitochondrial [Lingula anatina]|eukprot:XP_013417054.1 28S ribosomal protein S35, mitochondrial [Lingula anatina]